MNVNYSRRSVPSQGYGSEVTGQGSKVRDKRSGGRCLIRVKIQVRVRIRGRLRVRVRAGRVIVMLRKRVRVRFRVKVRVRVRNGDRIVLTIRLWTFNNWAYNMG